MRIYRPRWSLLPLLALVLTLLPPGALAQAPLTMGPLNPAYLRATREPGPVMIIDPRGIARRAGAVPPTLYLPHLTGRAVFPLTSLPASYDLRTLGKLTPIRDQGSAGTCWAFASFGSLESCLLPAGAFDFSENNLKNNAGFTYDPNNGGGNADMTTAYLSRWGGPVSETDDPYNPNTTTSPTNLPLQRHVQEVLFLPERAHSTDNNTIKQSVMTYGAVYTHMYWDSASFNNATNAFYFTGNYGNGGAHAVDIVGWNDLYSRANFTLTPPGDGAFIVRNSWGVGFGERGYFYVSYYDVAFGMFSAVFNNAETVTNYSRIYCYDPLGCIGIMGYGSNTAWFANVFTAASSESVAAAGLYTGAVNSTYTLYIYLNPSRGPLSTTPAATVSGSIAMPGYHTITLPTPVKVTAGQKFSVVVKLTTPDDTLPIPFEGPYGSAYGKATASAGQSYVSGNGTSWTDLTTSNPNSNVCLKAFAKGSAPVPTVQAPVFTPAAPATFTNSMSVSLSCPTPGATIRYTTNGSEPTSTSTIYRWSLTLYNTTTVKAKAFLTGQTPSATTTGIYTRQLPTVATPVLNPANGAFTTSITVKASCATAGATLRYTTNGTEPTATSALYIRPLTFSRTTTFKVKAFKYGMTTSNTTTGTYTKQ